MVKGIKKNMIVLRRPESRLFEAAYFILKEESPPACDSDILAEANRILSENASEREVRARGRSLLPLFASFIAGALLGGLLPLIFLL